MSKRTPGVDVPPYVYEVIGEMRNVNLDRVSNAVAPKGTAPVLISVVRDEIDRLPDFLRHYRASGITRFVFIDNNSNDGTREFLSDQQDVDLLFTDRSFTWQRKHGWIFLAIMMIGRGMGTWFLYADADEHIVFDGMPERTFSDLAGEMSRKGLSRVRGVMLDMYAEGPLLQSDYLPTTRLSESYPFFDRAGYVEAKYPQIISRKGGPRQRAFGHVDPTFRPEMTKYPLFQMVNNDVFANPHHIWPYEDNFASPCYLGILHYKFLPGVIDRINRAVADKNYWGGSKEYACYQKVLTENPNLSLHGELSERYTSPASLTKHGIIETWV